MKGLKFLIEKTDQERVFLFHFNDILDNILPRISYREEVEDRTFNGMPMPIKMGTSIDYKPNSRLTGIENIKPISRYTLAVQFGKAFDYDTIITSFCDTLELDICPNDHSKWLSNIRKSYPDEIIPHIGLGDTILKSKKKVASKPEIAPAFKSLNDIGK